MDDKRLARSLAQPKEKRSKHHNAYHYVGKPYRIGFAPKPPPITLDKKKMFAIKFLTTLAKLENGIDKMLLILQNERPITE